MKALDWINLIEPKTGRVSAFSIHGSRAEYAGSLGITGELTHGSHIEPKTVHDADKLITWLKEWKEKNK